MNLKTLLLTAILLSNVGSAFALQTRIIGGEAVDTSLWPSTVSLELSLPSGKTRLCAGTLISNQWVLTAAHCFHDNQMHQVVSAIDISAFPGAGDLNKRRTQDRSDVQNIYIHPQFAVNSAFDYDFALIELTYPVNFPVSRLSDKRPETGEITTVLGWGVQSISVDTQEPVRDSISFRLRQVEIPIVSNDACTRAMSNDISENMICAGLPQGGKDACDGDSGGPMMVYREGVFTQVGLVSFGIGCAQPNRYGVYSRITSALPWILELVPQVVLTNSSVVERRFSENGFSEPEATALQGDEGVKLSSRSGGGAFSLVALLLLLTMFHLKQMYRKH